MTHKIAISMPKGGVGRSTATINLSAAFGNLGRDVLAVDVDPNGGMTHMLGLQDRYYNADSSLFDVFSEKGDLELTDLDDLITDYQEFDVIPAQSENRNLEGALFSEPDGRLALGKALDEIKADYDFILIDSPSNLGQLFDGVLLAAENLLLPIYPNRSCLYSIWLLADAVSSLRREFNYQIQSLTVLLNEDSLDDPISPDICDWVYRKARDGNVFEVPCRKVVRRATEREGSLFAYQPEIEDRQYLDQAQEIRNSYIALAQHFEDVLSDVSDTTSNF